MSGSWIFIIAAIAILVLLVLVRLNLNDQRKFTEEANRDYKRSKDEEGDIEIDEIKK